MRDIIFFIYVNPTLPFLLKKKIRITNERVVLKVLSDQQIKNHSKVPNEPDSST